MADACILAGSIVVISSKATNKHTLNPNIAKSRIRTMKVSDADLVVVSCAQVNHDVLQHNITDQLKHFQLTSKCFCRFVRVSTDATESKPQPQSESQPDDRFCNNIMPSSLLQGNFCSEACALATQE